MAHWNEHQTEFVQTIITTKLRIGGPRIYANRVQQAQKLAVAAYKVAFEKAMLAGQIDSHTVARSAFKEYYENVDLDQVFKVTKKVIKRKKSA